MSLLEYNIRNALLFFFCAGGSLWLLYEPARKYKNRYIFKGKISVEKGMKISGIILCALMLITGIFGMETKEYSKTVTVEDCISTASIGDIVKTYTLYTVDDSKDEFPCRTPIFSNKQLKKQAEQVKSGDRILIKYTRSMNYVYYIEIVDANSPQ